MKKLLFMAFMGSFLFTSAQNQPGKIQDNFPKHNASSVTEKPGKKQLNKADYSGWYDIIESIYYSAPNSSAFQAYVTFVMNDSNGVIVDDDGSKYSVFQHSSGFTFDPKDQNLLNSQVGVPVLSKFNPWTFDSVFFRYLYVRNVDSINGEKVVDTLVVQFLKMPAVQKGSFGSGSDAQVYAKPGYSPAVNLAVGQTSSVQVLLTGGANPYVQGSDADSTTTTDETSWGTKGMTIPVGMSVGTSPDNIAAFTFSFRPMLKPNLGDTLVCGLPQKPVNRYNYFGFRYYVNSGDDGNQVDQKNAYNNMLVLTKYTRYGQTNNGWTGYIPGNAYFQAQYLDFSYHLTSNNLSSKEINKDGYGLGNAYPNPAYGDQVSVDFKLPKAEKVTMTLSDITGKKVKDITVNTFSAGDNTVTFDVTGLNSGIYFYTITAGNFTATKKVTVVR